MPFSTDFFFFQNLTGGSGQFPEEEVKQDCGEDIEGLLSYYRQLSL